MNRRRAGERIEPPTVGERYLATSYIADTASEHPNTGRESALNEWTGARTSEDAHPITRAFDSNPPAESVLHGEDPGPVACGSSSH